VELIYNKADNKLSEIVAEKVETRLGELFAALEKSGAENYDKSAGKINILILDRSYDPITPMLRDFFYQPLVYDLLSVNSDIVR